MSETSKSNADVTPEGGPTRRFSRKLLIALVAAGVLLVLSAAGAAYATYDYSESYSGRIFPGTVIAGVDVSGMTPERALDAVQEAIGPQLDRTVTLTWKEKSYEVTPRELGARSDAEVLVAAAVQASGDASWVDKATMRFLGSGMGFERAIAITYPKQGVRGYIEGVASNIDRDVVDASIDYSTGWVELVKDRTGRELDVRAGRKGLRDALRSGEDTVALRVKEVAPEVTRDEFGKILLVRIGENKLYLYEKGKITHSWPVATGQPEYPTPTGTYSITEKRYLPTWINPALDTWGKDLPAQIPPGPGNPLGLRALNWSAPAIRFHGTEAIYSLGYNASHGCVRMANADVIELYDLVDVGTPIVSTVVAPLRPLYVSSSTTIDPDRVEPAGEGEDDDSGGGKGKGKGD